MSKKPTAKQAWDKLLGHMGSVAFYLTPDELKAIDAAVAPKKAIKKETK